jgi:hypothetical protein
MGRAVPGKRYLRPTLASGVRSTLYAVVIVLMVAAGCGGHGPEDGSGKLETISSVAQFERAFDDDAGHPRIVLLLSPT